MSITEKHKINNPLYFNDSRVEALEEALSMFMETFNEYAIQYELSEEQMLSFKQLILDAYLEKKASYFVESKLFNFNSYLSNAFDFAMNGALPTDNKEHFTKYFYYNKKQRFISND